jgi:hypothetical protein
MKKTVAAFVAASLLFAGGLVGWQWARKSHLRAEAERTRAARATAEIRAEIKRLTDEGARQTSANSSSADESARAHAPSPPPAEDAASSRNRQRREKRNRLLMTDPELHALYKRQLRAGLQQSYAPFVRELKWAPQRTQQFLDLLMRRDDAEEELWRTADERHLSRTDPAIKARRDQLVAEQKSALQTFLGAEGSAALERFDRAKPAREVVADAASLIAYTSTPMTREQIDQLTPIFAEGSVAYRNGGNADGEFVDWDTVVARASTFLPAPQLEAVRAEADRRRMVRLLIEFYTQRGFKYQ